MPNTAHTGSTCPWQGPFRIPQRYALAHSIITGWLRQQRDAPAAAAAAFSGVPDVEIDEVLWVGVEVKVRLFQS